MRSTPQQGALQLLARLLQGPIQGRAIATACLGQVGPAAAAAAAGLGHAADELARLLTGGDHLWSKSSDKNNLPQIRGLR